MGLLDNLNKVADKASKVATDKISDVTQKVDNTVSSADTGNVLQGMLGNYQKQNTDSVTSKWSHMLIENEKVVTAYKLIRDEIVVTNHRLLFVDAQGVTGQKKAITQIFLDTIIDVKYTAAGFGFDDTDIYITYLTNPYYKAHETSLSIHHFEFPKKLDVSDFYKFLVQLSVENRVKINS
ncbi:PH domain-containing protein [Lactococcus petauri]|nr:PH domain-containing protein [Lactococcus petauri]